MARSIVDKTAIAPNWCKLPSSIGTLFQTVKIPIITCKDEQNIQAVSARITVVGRVYLLSKKLTEANNWRDLKIIAMTCLMHIYT